MEGMGGELGREEMEGEREEGRRGREEEGREGRKREKGRKEGSVPPPTFSPLLRLW